LANSRVDENNQDSPEAIFKKGMFLLTQRIYKPALETFVKCHQLNYRTEEIEKIIMINYYEPQKEQFKENYVKNVKLLMNYQFIKRKKYPDFSQLKYYFIPYSESKFIIYDKNTAEFKSDFDLNQELNLNAWNVNDVILLNNEYKTTSISACEKKTRDPRPFLWMKVPQYLYYEDFDTFVEYLQVVDYTKALQSERLVFLFGRDEVDEWFSDPQAMLPGGVGNVQDRNADIVQVISHFYSKKATSILALQEEVNTYYDSLSRQELLKNIENGKPRILFITSRFTTALQYSIRDCILACDNLGIPSRLLIEKSDIHRNSSSAYLMQITEFKPDIIFTIDHFRWEFPFLPENVVFVNWVQDILPNITSKESASKLKDMDFILNAMITNVEFFLELGYPEEIIIEAPVVANPGKYKMYILNEQEKKEYTSDICAFSNTGNVLVGVNKLLDSIRGLPEHNELGEIFKVAYKEMYKMFYNEKMFYSVEQYEEFISGWFKEYGLSIKKEYLHIIAQQWKKEIGDRILRSVPLEWLHEKGYNMKIWGREWVDHPVLGTYAQGVAKNGEVLSKIINASKIVLGTNPNVTGHPRVFESILSNSFYLGCNVSEKHDWVNIRKYLIEDKEIVFFYNRADLYKKIDYYLENADKRSEIVSGAKKKILAKLNYEALMTRVIREIAQRMKV